MIVGLYGVLLQRVVIGVQSGCFTDVVQCSGTFVLLQQ